MLSLLRACSCPIYEATRRGLGAALLRKPAKLAKLVRRVKMGWQQGLAARVQESPSCPPSLSFRLCSICPSSSARSITRPPT